MAAASPTTAPTDDDDLTMDSKTNIIGLLIFTVIILVLFLCGGSLVWYGLWKWKEGVSKDTVDLEQLEGLLDERSQDPKSKKNKRKKDRSRSGRPKKSISMDSNDRPQSEWDNQRQGSEWDNQRQGSEWDAGGRDASQDSAVV